MKVEIEKSQGETYQVAHQSLIFKGQVREQTQKIVSSMKLSFTKEVALFFT